MSADWAKPAVSMALASAAVRFRGDMELTLSGVPSSPSEVPFDKEPALRLKIS